MPEHQEPEQIEMMQRLVEMSAQRTYLNAERNLLVWIRTALSLMIFGIAVDRFGLLLRRLPLPPLREHISPNTLSTSGGAALVGLGMLLALVSGFRYVVYARSYRRTHTWPYRHGPNFGFVSALLVALFGIALLVIMFMFTD
jgi:inner membrane protein YidH